MLKNCEYCGKEYNARQFNQKYCCTTCRDKANYQKEVEQKTSLPPKKCEICGTEFIPKTIVQTLCGNPECKKERSRRLIRQSKLKAKLIKTGEYIEELEPRKCIICGEEFIPKHKGQKLCGKDECFKERNYRQKQGIPESEYPSLIGVYNFGVRGDERICPTCGKTFIAKTGNQIYCSRNCKEIPRKLENKGCLLNERTCIICGKKFIPNSGQQQVCSEECRDIRDKKRCREYNATRRPKAEHEPKTCKYCGEEFIPKYKTQIYCCIEHQKLDYKENNIESEKGKKYYLKNKEVIQAKHKEYYRNNKAKVMERGRKNRALRRAVDPDYVLKCRIRSQIRDHLKRNLLTKNFHTFELLGYTTDDLRQHLESQFEANSKPDKEKMSWENMGQTWHIDHIRPCVSFKFANEDGSVNQEAIKECWKLDNLQPLYAEDNMAKSNWYNGKFYQKGAPI